MPSDQHLSDSQFDQDSFPIVIGFEPADGPLDDNNTAEAGLAGDQNEAEDQTDLVLATAPEDAAKPQEALTGYELVADMMRRQDEALEQLDDLNARIELAIKQISASRKREIEALEAEGQTLEQDDQTSQPKAA